MLCFYLQTGILKYSTFYFLKNTEIPASSRIAEKRSGQNGNHRQFLLGKNMKKLEKSEIPKNVFLKSENPLKNGKKHTKPIPFRHIFFNTPQKTR